jgi:hypothetical protein
MAPLDGVTSSAIGVVKLFDGQVRLKVNVSCHPHVLQRYDVPAY